MAQFPQGLKLTARSQFSISVFFYLVAGFVAFFPCLAGGQAYFDNDLFSYCSIAWSFLRTHLSHGLLPLWNPYLLGGQPFFADPNSMVCYPLLYPALLFPIGYGFGVFYFIHFFLAALGMHFWLKTLRLSENACRVGALFFGLSGFFWCEIVHPQLLAAFAWTSWWGWALEKTSERLKPFWAFVSGLVFAFLFLAGFFQVTLGALYGGGSYLSFRLLARRNWLKSPEWGLRIFLAPLFFLWGSLPLLAMWIPAHEFLGLSARLHAQLKPSDYAVFQGDRSLDPHKLTELLFPVPPYDSSGNFIPLEGDHLAYGGYLGPWVFFLAALAFRPPRKMTLFLLTACVASLFISFGKYFPLHWWLCRLAPGFDLVRVPSRFLFLYVIGASLLAAMGYEALSKKNEKRKGKDVNRMLVILAFYGMVIVGLAVWQGKGAWIQLIGLGSGTLSLYLWISKKTYAHVGQWLFLISLFPCLLLTGWNSASSRRGPSSNFDFNSRSDVLQRLKTRVGLARVFVGDKIPYPVQWEGRDLPFELPTNTACLSEVRNAGGYNPLYLDKMADLYTLPAAIFSQLMDVEGFVTGNEKWRSSRYQVEDWGPVKFYKNPREVHFAYAPNHVSVILDDQLRLTAMRKKGFQPYETAYFSEPLPNPGISIPAGTPAHLRCELTWEDPNEELFKIDMDRPGWVVFSEIMYPGWKAWVDGKPSSLLTANHIFRSVWVPAGRHEIRFSLEPFWLKFLKLGLIAWVLSVIVLFSGPWRRKFSRGD